MANLQQILPLNHPHPAPTSQPLRKKLRSRNAKPKLTIDQITNNDVVQSALRIGRRARANPPKPGEEHHALDKLLNRMAGWANNIAPHYSLAEFIVAAHGIAGNRELRPMLSEFRLAELRDVTSDDNNPESQRPGAEQTGDVAGSQRIDHPGEGPVHADAGPVEADVGPEDDDWDELDLMPDEAIEVRRLPNVQPHASASVPKEVGPEVDTRSPEIEARIERNRLAAIARREKVMARLKADREADKALETTGRSTQDSEETHEANRKKSAGTSASPNLAGKETLQGSRPKRTTNTNREGNSSPGPQKGSRASDIQPPCAETGADLYQDCTGKNEINVKNAMPTLPTEADEKSQALDQEFTQKGQSSEHPAEEPERRGPSNQGSSVLEEPGKVSIQNEDEPCTKEALETPGVPNDHHDEDIDMEILAEFEAGDEL